MSFEIAVGVYPLHLLSACGMCGDAQLAVCFYFPPALRTSYDLKRSMRVREEIIMVVFRLQLRYIMVKLRIRLINKIVDIHNADKLRINRHGVTVMQNKYVE